MPKLSWTFFLILLFSISVSANYQTLETANFKIHFPEGYTEFAWRAAESAEWAHSQLSPEFRYLPSTKTDIVLLDSSDVPNGFADSLFYNRIGVFPVELVGYAYRSGFVANGADWLDVLLLHEYAHILQLDLNTGFARNLRRVFGRVPGAATPHIFQPYSLIEGIAVWQETDKTGGGRGTSGFYDMFLQAIFAEGRFLSGDQILGRYTLSGWQPGTPYYFYGYLFVDHLISEYGDSKFSHFLEFLADTPQPFDTALSSIYGLSFGRLWDDMERKLRNQVKLQSVEVLSTHLNTVGHLQRYPRFSPDGRYLAYFASGEVFPGIRLYDWHTGDDKPLVAGSFGDEATLSWLDSSTLLYGKLVSDTYGHQRYDLFRYDLDRKEETRLTYGKRAYGVESIADGHYAYLSRTTQGSTINNLDLSHVELSNRIASLSAASEDVIVISGTDDTGHANLMLVENGKYRLLTNNTAAQGNPYISSDGRYVLFDSNHLGNFDIFAFDRQDNQFYQVTNASFGAFAPTISPDNQWLVFMDYSVKGYQLSKIAFDPRAWTPTELPVETGTSSVPAGHDVLGEIANYSPWSSLRPHFWLPTVETDPQMRLGVYTAGKDALEHHAYDGMLGWNLESETMEYALNYRWQSDLPYRLGANVSLMQNTDLVDKLWATTSNALVNATVQAGDTFAAWRGLVGVKLESEHQLLVDPIILGQVGLGITNRGGKDYYRTSRDLSVMASQELNTPDMYHTVLVEWQETHGVERYGSFLVNTKLGQSDNPKGFAVGGLTGQFPMRGYERQSKGNPRLLTMEYIYPLLTIERGFGGYPLFFQEVTGSLFFDGANFATDNERWRAYGLELGIDIAVSYGATSLRPKVGLVRTTDSEGFQVYFRMNLGSFAF